MSSLEPVGVRGGQELRAVVVRREGRTDTLGVVHEVEDKGQRLPRRDAVEAGERLHRLDAVEALVDVHRLKQRLVEAGLVLLGYEQDLVVGRGEPLGERRLADRPPRHHVDVHAGLGELLARVRVVDGAAERDEGAHVVVAALGVM